MSPILPPTRTRRRTLASAVDDAALYSCEHQLHMASKLGVGAHWDLLPDIGCAHFIGHRELVCPAQIIGVVKGKTWEWGWASDNVTGPRSELARHVYAFGEVHNMPVFTTPKLTLDGEHDAERILVASKIMHRWWASFAFPIDGMVFYAALSHAALSLPAATPAAIRQTLRYAGNATPLHNGRRAVRSYAKLRGLSRQDRQDRTATRLFTPDGQTVTVTFDAAGAITGVR